MSITVFSQSAQPHVAAAPQFSQLCNTTQQNRINNALSTQHSDDHWKSLQTQFSEDWDKRYETGKFISTMYMAVEANSIDWFLTELENGKNPYQQNGEYTDPEPKHPGVRPPNGIIMLSPMELIHKKYQENPEEYKEFFAVYTFINDRCVHLEHPMLRLEVDFNPYQAGA